MESFLWPQSGCRRRNSSGTRFFTYTPNCERLGGYAIKDFPTKAQIKLASVFVQVFRPIARTTDLACGDQYVTFAQIPKWIHELKSVDLPEEAEDSVAAQELFERLKSNISSRLGHLLEESNLALQAAALDPHTGNPIVHDVACLRKLSTDQHSLC